MPHPSFGMVLRGHRLGFKWCERIGGFMRLVAIRGIRQVNKASTFYVNDRGERVGKSE